METANGEQNSSQDLPGRGVHADGEDFSGSDVGGGDCGFSPFERSEPQWEKVATMDTSPVAVQLRKDIRILINQYSQLEPRTSFELVEQLKRYNAEQLDDIYQCAIIDLQSIRGTPSSEMFIHGLGYGVERWTGVEGFTQRCLDDEDLNKELENELVKMMAWAGNKVNIVTRVVNNFVKAKLNLEPNPNKLQPKGHHVQQGERHNGMAKRSIHSIWDENGGNARSRDDYEESSGEENNERGKRKTATTTTKKKQKRDNNTEARERLGNGKD